MRHGSLGFAKHEASKRTESETESLHIVGASTVDLVKAISKGDASRAHLAT